MAPFNMDTLTARIIHIRNSDPQPSFSKVAEIINVEFATEYTKDMVQKIYQKYAPKITRKVVGVGDIHSSPSKLITEAIINEKPQIVFLGGDTLDASSFSTHPRTSREHKLKFKEEMRKCRDEFLMPLHENTGADLWAIEGNHENRVHRLLRDYFPDDAIDALFLNPLEIIGAGLDRYEVVSMDQKYHHPNGDTEDMVPTDYMYLVGDVLFSHMNFCGKNPGDGVKKLRNWAIEWAKPLGFPEIRCFVQFHGHKVYHGEVEGGHVALIEPGMGGSPASEHYKVGYDAKWGPGNLGAVSIEQEFTNKQWKTILSSIKILKPNR
jgi:hypothetical protein